MRIPRVMRCVALGATMLWVPVAAALTQTREVAARDSVALVRLVNALDDSSSATQTATTASLREHSLTYLPMLERWTQSSDQEFAQRAAVAIARSGPNAHDILRRFARSPFVDALSGSMIERIAIVSVPSTAELLEILDPLLRHESASERLLGVRALRRYNADAWQLAPALLRALEDTSFAVREVARWHIQDARTRSAYDDRIAARLVELLESPDDEERWHALGILGSINPQGRVGVPRAMELLVSDTSVLVRGGAMAMLVRQKVAPQELIPLLIGRLHDADGGLRTRALRSIGIVGVAGLSAQDTRALVDTIESYLGPRADAMPHDASLVLLAIGPPARDALTRALHSRAINVQIHAVRGLSRFSDDPFVETALLDALGNVQPIVRRLAGLALVGSAGRVESDLVRIGLQDAGDRADAAQRALIMLRTVRSLGVVNRCYEVSHEPWEPAIPAPRMGQLRAPQRVRFRIYLTESSSEGLPAMFAAEHEIRGVWSAEARWSPDSTPGSIQMDGARFGSDVTYSLRKATAGTFVGEATTSWDGYRGETQRARVRMTPIACSQP